MANDLKMHKQLSHKPKADTIGDLLVNFHNGKEKTYKNVKLFHDDTEGVSFYYNDKEDKTIWRVIYLPHNRILDMELTEPEGCVI